MLLLVDHFPCSRREGAEKGIPDQIAFLLLVKDLLWEGRGSKVIPFVQHRKRRGLSYQFLTEITLPKNTKSPRSKVHLRVQFKYFTLGWS